MSGGVQVIPARLQVEPVDMVAFDLEQDREGLRDASDAVREAWKAYRPVWREARRVDLAPSSGTVWRKTVELPLGLVRAGRAFGLVGVSGKERLTAEERARWAEFKARVLRADPQLWGLLWRYTSGEPVSLIAGRHDVEPRYVLASVALCCRWWGELCPSRIGYRGALS